MARFGAVAAAGTVAAVILIVIALGPSVAATSSSAAPAPVPGLRADVEDGVANTALSGDVPARPGTSRRHKARAASLGASSPMTTPTASHTFTPTPQTPTPRPTTDPAYFQVGFSSLPTVTFIIKLVHADTIAEARDHLANGQQISVMGLIEKEPADYNPGWSYHLVPETISLFEFATEVCDANPIYLEQHLDEACGAFLPDCRWCPWSSILERELPAPLSESIYLPVALNQTSDGPPARFTVTAMPGTPSPPATATSGPIPTTPATQPPCPPVPPCTPGPPPPTDTPCPPGQLCGDPCPPCSP